MHNIDQEKLTEFTHELSGFQTEADKTSSVDVYDRFAINKLEDHIVDLYQIAIDASHEGLQYLCECMRDNIRDHFITGTNISSEEFVLMTEWKSLVKVYLGNNEDKKIVEAIIANLSKPGWVCPLSKEGQEHAISILLGNSYEQDSPADSSVDHAESNRVSTDFDDYMQEASVSIADAFQSNETDEEDGDLEEITSLFVDEEPSLAECFEEMQANEPHDKDNKLNESDKEALQEQNIEQNLKQQEEIQSVQVSNEELSQIEQPEINGADQAYLDHDVDEKDISIEKDQAKAEFVENVFAEDKHIEKVEVSSEELANIQEPSQVLEHEQLSGDIESQHIMQDDIAENEVVKSLSENNDQVEIQVSEEELSDIQDRSRQTIIDEIFVDDSAHQVDDALDEDLSELDAVSALAEDQQDKIDVSDEELSDIDENLQHVADHESNEIPHEAENHNDEATADELINALSENHGQAKIEISEQELSDIQEAGDNSLENEFVDEDTGFNDSVDENLSSENSLQENKATSQNDALKALFKRSDRDPDVSEHQSIVSTEYEEEQSRPQEMNQLQEDAERLTPVMRALEAELYVPDASESQNSDNNHHIDISEYTHHAASIESDNVKNDKQDLLNHELINDSVNTQQQINGDRELTIAEEAIFGSDSDAVDDTGGFVDTSIEEILPTSLEDVNDSKQEDAIDVSAYEASSHVETVYIEPAAKQEQDHQPRSIIEAYVDSLASNKQQSKPVELEQELIETPQVEERAVTIEPLEDILAKYSDWSEQQKELLSLILTEIQDVIDQEDETLSVLHSDPLDEESILEMLTMYADQVERIGSAAEMVGLDALHKLCELIGFHFGDLARASVDMIVNSEDLIKQWPLIIYAYLRDIYDASAHEEAISYISHEAWARTIREDIKSDLKHAFSQSTIHVEHCEQDQRITTASEQHVDISVPNDVQPALLDGLLQELPHQTEEFSSAIQALINDDYLSQLEISQRIAHTIKGAANTVGIVGVATLTHQLEDILQALVKAQAKPNKDLHVALVDASDCLEQMTEYLLEQGERPQDAVQTLQVILDWANYIDEFGPPSSENVTIQVATDKSTDQNTSNEVTTEKATVQDKSKSAQEASLRVPANMIDDLINQSGESIIANLQMHENVTQLLRSLRDIRKNREDVYTLSQKLEHMIDVQGTQGKYSVHVGDDKFDPLELDKFNELHTYSRRLIEATADSVELVKDLEERLYTLESVIADQSRSQKDNQYAILKTRMAPVESIIARLKRGVRQSSKISQKQVELKILGAETLLDSKILNNLIDPLMHLLRNAVDHGVESEQDRLDKGKSIPALITLSFEQVGERLEIKCSDDGQGLDTDQIFTRALDKGLISESQELSEQEIHQIIMHHGFSTRDTVTQLSGRGIGMDVVYSSIKDLNGSVQLNSEKNQGMTVEISLPVSLLSAHALLIPTRDGTIAVSTSGIEEILQVNSDDLIEADEGLTLKVEQGEFPAIYLEQLLKTSLAANKDDKNYSALLIETMGSGKKVVLVNEIRTVSDIIIKPFSHYLPKVSGLVGATVLGNGDVAAVVDVVELLLSQSELIGTANKQDADDLEIIHQSSVLVVEDSISTRRSLAEFMQDLNYKVYTAKDGVEAVEIMRQHVPTIVVTDLEMPRMNGLELTSHVRSHEETKDVPVIMLTSRTTEKHKQEAKSIGVNEYLTKPFVEDVLLQKVQMLTEAKA